MLHPKSIITRLPWDSEFFGFTIGRLSTAPSLEDLEEARAVGYRCLYYFGDHAGHDPIEIRIDFLWRGEARDDPIVKATKADLDQLLPIVAGAFSGSRFSADPGFEPDRVTELYETWLRNSFEGFADCVLTDPTRQSFVTVTHEGGCARIGLIAVAESARGKGLGRQLVKSVQSLGAAVRVATQSHNVVGRRLYEACGFRLDTLTPIHHYWL